MILFWILLGALMASALWFMYVKVHAQYKLSAVAWILTIISVLWGGFTLAWIGSSIAEKAARAAGMGCLAFGIILLVLIVITRVIILKDNPMPKTNATIRA